MFRAHAQTPSNSFSCSAWTNDASTGIDPSIPYTHAVKFGGYAPSIVINEVFAASWVNQVELLVVQDGLSVNGMVLRDFTSYSSRDTFDGAGYFKFKDVPLWHNLPAGTIIVLTTDNSSWEGRIGDTIWAHLYNSNYFEWDGHFNIESHDMVMLKDGNSSPNVFRTNPITGSIWGTANALHTVQGGRSSDDTQDPAAAFADLVNNIATYTSVEAFAGALLTRWLNWDDGWGDTFDILDGKNINWSTIKSAKLGGRNSPNYSIFDGDYAIRNSKSSLSDYNGFNDRSKVENPGYSDTLGRANNPQNQAFIDALRTSRRGNDTGRRGELMTVVNGLKFSRFKEPDPSGDNFTTIGLNGLCEDNPTDLLGASSGELSRGFFFGKNTEVLQLTGLTPGRAYVASLFSVGAGAPGTQWQNVSFSILNGGGFYRFDQNAFGRGRGIRIDCRYVADSRGRASIQIDPYNSQKPFHLYGFVNRVENLRQWITFKPLPDVVVGQGVNLPVGNNAATWQNSNVAQPPDTRTYGVCYTEGEFETFNGAEMVAGMGIGLNPISLSSSDTNVAIIGSAITNGVLSNSGAKNPLGFWVIPLHAGSTTITASAARVGAYQDAAAVSQVLNVRPNASAAVNLSAPTNLVYDGTTKAYGATVMGSQGFSYSYTGTGSTVYSSSNPPTDAGSYTLTATSTDPSYPVSKTISFAIDRASNGFSFGSLPLKTVGDGPFALSPTNTTCGAPITFTSSNTNVARISGSTVTLVGPGESVITASQSTQAGFSNYVVAATQTQTLTVRSTQTISFAPLAPRVITSGPLGLTATASSGLPVTYQSSNTNVARISGSSVTLVGVGTAVITASQEGDPKKFASAPNVSQTLTVTPQSLNADDISLQAPAILAYDGTAKGFTAQASFVAKIAAGGNNSAAILKNGTVVVWGDESFGKCDPPAGLNAVEKISIGGNHVVAMQGPPNQGGYKFMAWGNDAFGQVSPFQGAKVYSIAAGYNHTVVLSSYGTVETCGLSDQGQADFHWITQIPEYALNWGATNVANHPISYGNGSGQRIVRLGFGLAGSGQVYAGYASTYALFPASDYNLMFNDPDIGKLAACGQRNNGAGYIPEVVPNNMTNAMDLAVGGTFVIALKNRYVPFHYPTNATDLAIPSYYLKTIDAWGWMSNNATQTAWIPADLSTNVTAIAAGSEHALALKTDGTVAAWGGGNYYGQTTVPSGLTNIVAIAAGDSHNVALKSDGTVVAWGNNQNGQTTIPSSRLGVARFTYSYVGRNGTTYGPSSNAPSAAGAYTVTATSADPNYTGSKSQDFMIAANVLSPTNITIGYGSVSKTLTNGSFEANRYTNAPGNAAGNGGVINGWTLTSGTSIGLNSSAMTTNANNGAVPNGSNVAFIQNVGALTQTLTGLTPGRTYQVSCRVNARSDYAQPVLSLSVDGKTLVSSSISPVNTTGIFTAPYRQVVATFIAGTTNASLSIGNNSALAGNTLLLDDVSLAELTTPLWTSSPWNNDASSGLDSAFVYTHAYKFGATNGFTVNGVAFTGVAGTNPAVTNKLTTSGFVTVTNNLSNNLVGTSRALANDCIFGGEPESITLSGLTAGREYVLSLFTVGNGAAGGGWNTFKSGTDLGTIDQQSYGSGNGLRLDYRYIAATNGTLTLSISPLTTGGTFRLQALANREATPNTLSYDGAAKAFAAAAPGVSGFTYSYSGSGTTVYGPTSTPPILAGTYTVTATAADPNFNSATRSTGFVIAPRPLTISGIAGVDKVYDGTTSATLSGSPAYQGLVPGDVFAVSGSPTASFSDASAGTGKVVAISGYTSPSANYSVIAPSVVASITARPLTVTAAAKTKTFGAADPAWTYTSSGLVGTDAVTGLPVRAAGENVGTYAITAGTVAAGSNYSLSFVGSSLTISPAPVNSSKIALITSNNLTYDGTAKSYKAQTNRVTAIAAGNYHALALMSDGSVVSWGNNGGIPLTNVPAELSGVTSIAAGDYAQNANCSFAVRSDGTVVAWNPSSGGLITNLIAATNVTSISAGPNSCVGLKNDGTLVEWNNPYNQAPSSATNVVSISSGGVESGSCVNLAVKRDGSLVVWGPGVSWARGYGYDLAPPTNATGVTSAATYGYTVLASKSDGSVMAWGSYRAGQTAVPASATNIVSVAMGTASSLALKADGTVVAWGSGSTGITTVPSSLTGVTSLKARDFYALALKSDGQIVSWGTSGAAPFNMTPPSSLNDAVSLAGGFTYSYRGTGLTSYGPSTNAPTNAGTYIVTATAPQTDPNYAITKNVAFTIARSTNTPSNNITLVPPADFVYNAGPKAYGTTGASNLIYSYTGTGATTYGPTTNAPTNVGSYSVMVTATTVDGNYTTATRQAVFDITPRPIVVTADSKSRAFGQADPSLTYSVSGLADSDTLTGSLSRASGSNVGSYSISQGTLSAGSNYVMSFTPGTLTVTPAILDSSYLSFTPPSTLAYDGRGKVFAPKAVTAASIAAGPFRSLAVLSDGRVISWGQVQSYSGAYSQEVIPSTLTNALMVAAGNMFTVALKSDQTVTAWGDNSYGVCDPQPNTHSQIPIIGADVVAAGGYHAVALQKRGTNVDNPSRTWAWGNGANGETGLDAYSGINTAAYTLRFGWRYAKGIAAGYGFTLVLGEDGKVSGYGYGYGPIPSTATNVSAIAAGAFHGLALKNDGSVLAWGNNGFGQTNVPAGLNSVKAITAGTYLSMALRTNGTVAVWGYSNAVTPPAGLTNVSCIAAGAMHALALQSNGTVVAWGDNSKGQTTVPDVLRIFSFPTSNSYVGTGSTVYGPSGNAPTNVGTYAVTTVARSSDGNYQVSQSNAFSIDPNALAPSSIALAPPSSLVYSGSPKSFTATAPGVGSFTYSYLGNGSTTYGPSSVAPTMPGSYSVLITSADPNYTGGTWQDFTISPGVLSSSNVTMTPPSSLVYDGLPKTYAASAPGVSGFRLSYSGTGSTTYGPSTNPPVNAGTYSVTATPTDSNYTGVVTGNFTITARPVTVTAVAASKTFGSPDPVLTFNATGLLGSDTITGSPTREAGESVGIHPILRGSLFAGPNYSINYIGADLSIGPADLFSSGINPIRSSTAGIIDSYLGYGIRGIAAEGSTVYVNYYGYYILVYSMVGGGLNMTSVHQVANLPGGNNQMALSSGYLFVRNGDVIFRISLEDWSSVPVSADSAHPLLACNGWLSGNLFSTPDGKLGCMGLSSGGQFTVRFYNVAADGLSLTWDRDCSFNDTWSTDEHGLACDGTYLYRLSFLEGYKTYDLSSGNVVNDGRNWDIRTIDSGETISNPCFITRNHATGQLLVADFDTGKILFSPPTGGVSLKAPDSLVYDGNPKNYSATADGVSGFTYSYSGAGTTTYGPSPVGPVDTGMYILKVTPADPNYKGSLTKGFSITANAIATNDVSVVTPLTSEYDGTPKNQTVTAGGVSGFNYSYVGVSPTVYGPSTNAPVDAGTYSVTATSTDPNHLGSYDFRFLIAPKRVNVVAGEKTRPFGTPDPELTYESEGLLPSDLLTGALTRATGENVGTYAITQGTLTAGPNYSIYFTGANLNITPSTLSQNDISITPPDDLVYGNSPKSFAAFAPGVGGFSYSYRGTASTDYGPSTTPPANAGTYIVTAAPSDGNYSGGSTREFTIAKAANNLAAFGQYPGITFGVDPFTITPPVASSGLPATLSVKSGPATISGNTLTVTGTGTVVVAADQPGNSNYLAAEQVTTSFSVAPAGQSINFGALGEVTCLTPPLTLQATASSGLPVSFSSDSTNISIAGNVMTILGAGTASITASQPGNSNWSGAAPVTNTLVIAKVNNTIEAFRSIPNQIYSNGASVTVTIPTASSLLPVTLSVLSGPATISGNTVTVTGTGTVLLAANQSGNANYKAAEQVTTSFRVASAGVRAQTITFGATSGKVYGMPPFALSAVASSGLPVSYSSFSTNISIASNMVTILGSGTASIIASQAGDTNYAAARPITNMLVIGKAVPIISLDGLSQTYNGTTRAVSATTVPANLLVSTTYNGNYNPPTNAGSYTVVATVKDANYAGSKTGTMVVAKSANVIGFAPMDSRVYGDAPFVMSNATASSGLPATYVSKTPAVARLQGNMVTIVGAGTATITASQGGDSNTLAAMPVSQQLVVARASNTISSFGQIADTNYAPNALVTIPDPLPTASSGLPVIVTVKSGPGVKSGTKQIKLTGAGVVVLAANQAGSTKYNPAAEVTRSFVVGAGSQTLQGFAPISGKTNGTAPFAVTLPRASSRLPAILSVLSGPATVTNSTVTLTGAGTVVLAADQPGNTNYLAAPQVTTSFSVARGKQTISFAALATINEGTTSFPLGATASSGLPVSYSSSSTNISISSNMVTILGGGAATITASQSGDTNWNAAANVVRTLIVMGSSSGTNDTTNQIAGVGLAATIPTIPVRTTAFPLIRPSNRGAVIAWGDNTYNQTNIPAGLTNVVQLSSWGAHSLALKTNGAVVAWGWNAYGQTNVPASIYNVAQVAAGVSFSAALRTNGSIIAWGDNSLGQTNIPAGLTNAVQIAAGSDHALALRSDGSVTGWGWNAYGQTTIPDDVTNVVQIAAGYLHSVALKANGTVAAWGDDTYGETDVPVGLTNVVRIATGLSHTVALKSDGTVVVWGWNNAGQTNVPAGLTGVAQIAAGGNAVYAVTTNGTLVTWGDNTYGQRKPPSGLTNVIQFVLGLYHGLGLKK